MGKAAGSSAETFMSNRPSGARPYWALEKGPPVGLAPAAIRGENSATGAPNSNERVSGATATGTAIK